MSNTIPIRFRATSEHFDVPYRMQTTIQELIEYVCIHSTVLSNTNPDNYYMAINNSDVLNKNQTVEEIGLDQPDRFQCLDICIKTRILMHRILRSHMELWQSSTEQEFKKGQKMSAAKESNDIDQASSSTNQQQVQISAAISNNNDNDNEVHILVCGGPKVGKSTLINALCGCPVAKTKTIGLDPCTKKTSYYQLNNIYFWDTPGIQQWSHLDIDSYLNSSTQRQKPLCMFYCASPGSFTKLKPLEALLDDCVYQQHIFCVLVVTNMLTSVSRHAILDEFKTLLNKYVNDSHEIREERGIWYYGQIGLCTMVNSQEYINEDTNKRCPQQGINELVLALTKSFSGTYRLNDWLKTIEQNRQFWLDNQEELFKMAQKPHEICLSEMI